MENKKEVQLIADEAVKIAIENPRLSLVDAVRLAEKTFKKEKGPIAGKQNRTLEKNISK